MIIWQLMMREDDVSTILCSELFIVVLTRFFNDSSGMHRFNLPVAGNSWSTQFLRMSTQWKKHECIVYDKNQPNVWSSSKTNEKRPSPNEICWQKVGPLIFTRNALLVATPFRFICFDKCGNGRHLSLPNYVITDSYAFVVISTC